MYRYGFELEAFYYTDNQLVILLGLVLLHTGGMK